MRYSLADRRCVLVAESQHGVISKAQPHAKGVASLRRMVDDRSDGGPPIQSVLEKRFDRLIRRDGLPAPTRQFRIFDGRRLVAQVDFAYPGHSIAIELDGYAYHSSRGAWQADRQRDNRLIGEGWRVLRFTWEDVESRPGDVLREVRRVLGAEAQTLFGAHG